jgi:TetR/AcrR family transcriptional regulator, transcriptional repressor of aconitase
VTKVNDRYLEERRQQILDAARQVFVQKGYASATMQDIAAEADLAAGSLYRYFPGKSDLIAEVAMDCCAQDIALFTQTASHVPSPAAALRELGEEVREQMRPENRAEQAALRLESYTATLRDDELRSRVAGSLNESIDSLSALIQQAQDAGEFQPRVNARQLSTFLHTVGAGLGTLGVPLRDELDSDGVWTLLMRLLEPYFLPTTSSPDA